jgi:aryl-alcohol dehydrogenase (NADP+)
MQHRPLGRTSLAVSPVCLGTMTFGGQVEEAAARSMIDLCLERGVNFLDTANVYAGGKSEEMLGRILAGRRDRFVLATKVGLPMGDGANQRGLAPAAIRQGIDDSLRRLQTDYVDLYYLHLPDYSVPLEATLAALDELVRAGKVRFIGASNYASWQLCHMLWLAEKNGWQPMHVVQPMYNLLARGIEQELLPMCRQFELAVVPYNPLAGGLLTGKQPADKPLAGSRFERMPAYQDRYWHPANFAAVQELTEVARRSGRPLARLALAWLLQSGAVTSVILGASRFEHLQENIAAVEDDPLPAEALAACDQVWKTLRGITPVYNR